MVSPTLKQFADHASVGSLVVSAIALAASTTLWKNPIVASFSTFTGTASAYMMVGLQRDDERKKLIEERNSANAHLNSAQQDARTLEHDKRLLESHLKSLETKILSMEVAYRELSALQNQTQAECDSLQRFKQEVDRLKVELDSLKAENTRLDREQTQDNLDLLALQTTHTQTLEQLQQAKSATQTYKAQIEQLAKEIDDLRLKNNKYEAQFSQAEEVAKLRAEAKFADLFKQYQELQQKHSKTSEDYANLAEMFNELKALDDAELGKLEQKFAYLSGDGFKEVEQQFSAELSDRDRMLLAASARIAELEAPQFFDEIGEFVRANRLIKALWESEERICLDASEIVPCADGTGFEVYFNLRDRKSRGQAFIEALNERGNEFSVLCGTIKDLKFEYDRLNPHRLKTALIFRKPSKTESKTTIDKLWIPAEHFAAKVPKLLKKPMSRIMGSTGEGKGILVNLLLAIEANQAAPALTRLHDPMDDSEEDHWNIPKTSKGTAQSLKAVKSFIAEFDHRLENAIAQPKTLDIFDEVDILADRDSSINKSLLNCAKGMRHNGMRAYLIGQSPSVGKKGLEWADFDNFNCVYFGTAIHTAISKTPALESKSEALRKEYEKLKDYCDRQNEELGLEGWNEYRTGLIVTGGKAYFFELPNADSIVCDWNNLAGQPAEEAKTLEPAKSSFDCLQCNSSNTKDRSGRKKLANGLTRYYRVCHDCQHKFEVDLSS